MLFCSGREACKQGSDLASLHSRAVDEGEQTRRRPLRVARQLAPPRPKHA